MPGRPLLTAISMLVAALALAACGGSDGDDEKSEVGVAGTIEALVASTNPADCRRLATDAFLEQIESEGGSEAAQACEEDAGGAVGDPESVSIEKIEVDGGKASADVAFTGGSLDGQTLTVGLVKEGKAWKLNRLERFVRFDKEALIAASQEIFSGSEALSEEQNTCLVDELEGASEQELEQLVLRGSPGALGEIAESC